MTGFERKAVGTPGTTVLRSITVIALATIAHATIAHAEAANTPSPKTLEATPLAFTASGGVAGSTQTFSALGRGLGIQLTPAAAYVAAGQATLPLRVVGANQPTHPEALDPLPGKVNFLIGNDPSKWRTDVSSYARVKYASVLPGVPHLLRQLKPARIRFRTRSRRKTWKHRCRHRA